MKPLALASGHGRYITVIPERALVSVGEWPLHIAVKFLTVSLPKRLQYVTAVSRPERLRKFVTVSLPIPKRLQVPGT